MARFFIDAPSGCSDITRIRLVPIQGTTCLSNVVDIALANWRSSVAPLPTALRIIPPTMSHVHSTKKNHQKNWVKTPSFQARSQNQTQIPRYLESRMITVSLTIAMETKVYYCWTKLSSQVSNILKTNQPSPSRGKPVTLKAITIQLSHMYHFPREQCAWWIGWVPTTKLKQKCSCCWWIQEPNQGAQWACSSQLLTHIVWEWQLSSLLICQLGSTHRAAASQSRSFN